MGRPLLMALAMMVLMVNQAFASFPQQFPIVLLCQIEQAADLAGRCGMR